MPGVLVSTDELAAHPEWRVFDCRHDLKNTGYGRQAYARGHIPGALFLHLDDDLSGAKTGSNGRHPLPEVAAFARRMSDCGVGDDVQVVAYDNEGGIFAARRWWMLRWLGHERVAVLDGGLAGWKRGKRPLEEAAPVVAPREFVARPRDLSVSTAQVLADLNPPSMLILDARRSITGTMRPWCSSTPSIQGGMLGTGCTPSCRSTRSTYAISAAYHASPMPNVTSRMAGARGVMRPSPARAAGTA